jgi:hypothetical protein
MQVLRTTAEELGLYDPLSPANPLARSRIELDRRCSRLTVE